MPQQQAKSAAGLRGKRQAARRGEIGGIACLRQLGQNRRQSPAFERLFESPKRIARMRDPQDQQSIHGEPETIEAKPIGSPGFKRCIIGRNAEHLGGTRAVAGCRQARDGKPKPEGRAELQLAGGRELMQSPQTKTPLERRIEGGHAQP
jgi:hypothetical protein